MPSVDHARETDEGARHHGSAHDLSGAALQGRARRDPLADHRVRAHRAGPAWIYLVVDDPDAHYERAVAAGAEIVQPLTDEDYGSRGYTARDPEGNVWSFGTYQPATADD